MYLSTWKEIPDESEVTASFNGVLGNVDSVLTTLQSNNVFTVARRTADGQVGGGVRMRETWSSCFVFAP